MPENPLPKPSAGARPRFRSVITTVLLIVISVLIVRDFLVRRWGGSAPPASDVVRPSR
ncbi:hypothetical protein V1294_007342 [Bradyrhizobium sp. AZCC 1678]|jgi:hypothetical protein|uniref:Uncharacterized protein n=1 Tax=Bradyrhizobium algeriense TaxID=634784 RepID=A0ABU8BIT5_9BRAD